VRPFGCSSPKPPALIQQRPLPPISAFLDEIRERRLTKCIGHWARKVPPAGLGRYAISANGDDWLLAVE
jgi:hypothetical protein